MSYLCTVKSVVRMMMPPESGLFVSFVIIIKYSTAPARVEQQQCLRDPAH